MPGYNAATTRPAPKLLYRAEEAADLLSISRTAVFGLISSGDLPAIKIGGRRRIPRTSIEDYIARQLAAVTEAPEA
jgi:excisionase family DNA binding protein